MLLSFVSMASEILRAVRMPRFNRSLRPVAVIVAVCVFSEAMPVAPGQTNDCCWHTFQLPGASDCATGELILGYHGHLPLFSGFSGCAFDEANSDGALLQSWMPWNHLNWEMGFGPGDFPPIAADVVASTSPFVPANAASAGTAAVRPTQAGIIDLITGTPLLHEVDFELPFGGAVFRHVRTYGEPLIRHGIGPWGQNQEYHDQGWWWTEDGAYWDWNGMGWMMSENPILLVDSHYYFDYSGPDTPTRLYLILDSHHSIPFIREQTQQSEPRYVAPSWFDAKCDVRTVGGTRYFDIWLHQRSVKFTFMEKPGRLGRRFEYPNSLFHPPFEPPDTTHPIDPHDPMVDGADVRGGIPYPAFLQRIEDRYGNYAQMHYAPRVQMNGNPVPDDACTACRYNANEFGQLMAVTLVPARGTGPAWTIIYAYRSFGLPLDEEPTFDPNDNTENHPHLLHGVYAYRGNRLTNGLPATADLTVPGAEFLAAMSLDETDALEPDFIVANPDWEIACRYTYAEAGFASVVSTTGEPPTLAPVYPGAWLLAPDLFDPTRVPTSGERYLKQERRLMKVHVMRRQIEDDLPVATIDENRIYRYDWDQNTVSWGARLRAVFSNSTILKLLDQMRAADALTDPPTTTPRNVNDLLTQTEISMLIPPETDARTVQIGTPGVAAEYADISIDWLDPDAGVESGFGGLPAGATFMDAETLVDRRGGSARKYKIRHYFTPADGAFPYDGYSNCAPIVHYPYRHVTGNAYPLEYVTPQMNVATWTTFVDEEADEDSVVMTRRGLEMNAAGFTVRDRTWVLENDGQGGPTLISQVGHAEDFRYDCAGRLIEKRSRGWSADVAAGASENSAQGLIQVFEYADTCGGTPGNCDALPVPPTCTPLREPTAVKIKNGVGDAELLLIRSVTRDSTRPEEVLTETAFPIWNGTGDMTTYEYDHYTPDGVEPAHRPLKSRTLRREIYRVDPNDPNTAVTVIEKSQFDDRGNLTYSGSGVEYQGQLTAFFANRRQYNDYGQMTSETVDIPDGDMPDGWDRVSTDPVTATALNWTTTYEYGAFGPERIVLPNGREHRFVVRYVTGDPNSGTYTWTYKDLVSQASPPDTFVALSPLEVTLTVNGQLEWKKTLETTAFDGTPDGYETFDEADVIDTVTPEYGPNGSITGVTQAGADGSTLAASLTYVGLGGLSREQGPDGTITRYLHDHWGRLTHTYRGTRDAHDFWGTGNGQPPDDNMVLVEKRAYGDTRTDADRLVLIRSYREKPIDQYDEDAQIENNEDDIGWTTVHRYDWRMREVVVTKYGHAGGALSRTFTWYDNLDRARFTAEYDSDIDLNGVDPRDATPTQAEPTAAAILAAGGQTRPLSLTESTYNSRGLVIESRSYKVDSTTTPPEYLATFTSYDYADRVSETWSPGGPVTRTTYDAVGRQRMTRSLAKFEDGSLVEVSNTETLYDDDNRPFVTIHSERINDTNPATLDSGNSVRTFTRNWYDMAGRVTDTAAFGTGAADFRYSAEPANLTSQAAGISEPTTANFPAALFTRYEYDAKGRQVAVHNPGGDVTRTVYDDLGRQRLVIENANGATADERRITAYDYDTAGRLSRIAAVLPAHNGGAVDEFSDVDWGASDGSLQVTEMKYGATVVTSAAGHAAISANETWIAEVRYPDRETGQPSVDNHLLFTYYSDGLVASRTDGLGRTFTYAYDDLSRLTEVLVTTAGVPVEGNIRIAYTYTAGGQLGTVTAYRMDVSGGSGNTEVVAAQSFFHYDPGFQNLLYERQQLDGVATSASPTIDYEWAFAGAADGNYNRLTRMTYPTRINGGRRQINLGYATGANGAGVDSALGRITSITDQSTNASTSYTYGGMSRRLSLLLACGIAQSFAASGGIVGATGLDRFGRPTDLHYIGATAPLPGLPAGTVHRYEYRYDASGNRTHARVVQAPPNWNGGSGGTGTNRSWAYGYDALQRLTAADRGTATAGGNPGDPIPLATTDVATAWNLDNLGNWTGDFDPDPPPGTNTPGMTITYAPGAANETVDSRSHAVFFDNSLESIKTRHGAANPVETAYVVNLVGSTVFDGVYYYDYDAWNRLIRVSDAGTVTAASFDADGVLLPPAAPPTGSGPNLHVPGGWRVRYTYDGLGRLARKETPIAIGSTEARREDYRYDGVRRIQEAVTRWSGAV
ncbi:MAG: RHS repeat protein, partial [Phycisphaerales bacterium]|nr:RHS repeat protein [Phycisphaerales bacterium]